MRISVLAWIVLLANPIAAAQVDSSDPGNGKQAAEPESKPSLHSIARRASSAELVDWLRDDDVRWNAMAASRVLEKRSLQVEQQAELIQLFAPHLVSKDPQLRRAVTGYLQRIGRRGVGLEAASRQSSVFAPTAELMTATVGFLDGYTTCTYPQWIRGSTWHRDCVLYLLRQGGDWRAHLEPMFWQGLGSKPKSQRWIYAFLLASMEWSAPRLGAEEAAAKPRSPAVLRAAYSTAQVEELTGVLLGQLTNNHLHDDALMCMNALYRLGEPAIPYLERAYRKSNEHQQKAALTLLLIELNAPSAPSLTADEIRALNRFTWKCDNPIRGWRFGRDSH